MRCDRGRSRSGGCGVLALARLEEDPRIDYVGFVLAYTKAVLWHFRKATVENDNKSTSENNEGVSGKMRRGIRNLKI
jgi:hypothetical protein